MDWLTSDEISALLKNPCEGECVDFKEHQYALRQGGEHAKAALVKDILAFANTRREKVAVILCGVREESAGKVALCGVKSQLQDAELQQLVNEKTNRPVRFRCERVEYEGIELAAIQIDRDQPRPIYLRNDFGALRSNIVYVRRGSSTAQATPDEIQQLNRLPASLMVDGTKTHPNIRQMAERWLSVFDNHGVKRSQIPVVLQRPDLHAAYFHSWETTLQVLTEDLVEETCRTFNINRGWLDGDWESPLRHLLIDSQLRAVLRGMVEMRSRYPETTIIGFKNKRRELYKQSGQVVGILIRSQIMELNYRAVYSYLPISTGPNFTWSNEKYRWYMKRILLAARYLDMNFSGFTLGARSISAISDGDVFPEVTINKSRYPRWHPDDYVYGPEESEIAKETGDLSRLRKWVEGSKYIETLREARKMIPGLKGEYPTLFS